MGLFSKTTKAPEPEPLAVGKVSMLKKTGEQVSMVKTPLITATTSWVNDKDYDIAAEVVYTDGHVETVVTYPTEEGITPVRMQTEDGAVRHHGDIQVTGKGRPREIIDIRLNPRIRAVVIWGYSARKNNAGSFKRYEVELSVANGQQTITMPPEYMSDNEGVYTCVLGTIHNLPDGVRIEKLEMYSKGGERRPRVTLRGDNVRVEVDKGETNVVKDDD